MRVPSTEGRLVGMVHEFTFCSQAMLTLEFKKHQKKKKSTKFQQFNTGRREETNQFT